MDTNNEHKTEATIPESIVLGGVTYKVTETPELQQLVQRASQVEKSKLYSQIEGLRKQFSALEGVQIVPTEDSKGILDSLKGTFLTKEEFESGLKKTIQDVVQPLLQSAEQTKAKELAEYRNQLLKQNEGKCIPDLVKGNTKEELDAALQESIRIRTSIVPPAPPTAPGTQQNPNAPQTPEVPPQTPQTPAPQTNPQQQTPPPTFPNRQMPTPTGTGSRVKTMTDKEFAAQRDSLRQQLESMYGNTGSL